MSHSPHTNQVDIQLINLTSTSGFKHSRYALELYIVSDTPDKKVVAPTFSTTLDDEHTPGIFKTMELILPGQQCPGLEKLKCQCYLQWRPVVYTSNSRDLSESTGVEANSVNVPSNETFPTMNKTLLYALYGSDLKDMLVANVTVTFGSPEDGYYKKTKYHAW